MNKNRILSLVAAAAVLAGCATGNEYRSDTYYSSQVNKAQELETVTIVAIRPANVVVDNSEARRNAQIGGALLGAVTGALIGHNHSGSAPGALVGGVAGGAAGSFVSEKNTVPGITIVFKNAAGRTYSSTQVGQACEYTLGEALVVVTKKGETRVQPNNPYGCGR